MAPIATTTTAVSTARDTRQRIAAKVASPTSRAPRLDRDSLIGYAKDIGLDMKSFTASLDGMKHAAVIERDKKLAKDLDLYATPTFFLNGRKVIGDVPYDYLKKIVEEELKDAKR